MNENCYFCQKKIKEINYNDIETLKKFITLQGKIMSPRRTGTCAKHQRKIAKAVKRARVLSLLPVSNVHNR